MKKKPGANVAPASNELTPEDDAHRRSRYPELSREEYRHLLDFCARHNLNAWARPVYPVFRDCPGAPGHRIVEFELTIEGIRTIAHRTGQYAGNEVTQFQDDADGKPFSATAFAYRMMDGERYLYSAKVLWSERQQKERATWATMPRTMLGKCAEAAALRAAFPEQLGGIYVQGELDPQKIGSGAARQSLTSDQVERDGVDPNDSTPTSKMSFTLKLIHEFGLSDPVRREAVLQPLREKYPHLQSDDEMENPPLRFYATVLFLLASEPEKYGIAMG